MTQPTQPATQLVIDPRRHGESNSAFSYEDQSDIFCILLPQSTPAHKAVALIQEETPQHTVNFQRDVKIRQKAEGPHQEHKGAELDTGHIYPQGSGAIALRLSSNVKNPSLGGFLFGRNRARCDLVLGQYDEVKRVSNIHFRIYINEYGVIMIEDQSTNGTVVDGTLLRAKDKENQGFRLTIDQSSIIVLTMTPPEEDFRFFVQFPRRDDEAETRYQNNLTNYFHRQAQAQADRRARVGYGIAREPPNIFAAPDVGTPNQSVSYVGRHIREWKGGPKYNKIGTIGKGAFAVVYKLTAKYDGVPFAAKELEKRRFMKNGVLDQKVDMEMQIMRKIKHVNIVQYIEHIDWEEYLYIIMEYVPGGDLGSLITKTGRLQEKEASEMAAQLLSALKYLHEMNITHRDVKPDNILIQHRSPLQVKLTDFGLSKMVDSEETFLRTFCGTLLYCAPEVYSEYREYDSSGKRVPRGVDKKSLPPQRYGHAVDIWSLAGVLFYALCGTPPYPAKNGTTYQELLNYIMTQPLDIRPLQQAHISERGIRFVRSMLHTRPEHRATIEELEGSNWLTGESSLEMSIDEMDEVDLVGNFVDPRLEEGASQLSLQDPEEDPDNREIGDSEEHLSDLTELQQPEIPSSFDTSENSMGSESYGFMSNAKNPTGNDRLFGEVGVSALGSSGAIPSEHLPHPEVDTNFPAHSFSRSSLYASNEFSESFLQENYSQYPVTAPIHSTDRDQPHHTAQANRKTAWEGEERATRSSSLMGAESMVGHLNMHSPSSTTSPAADRDISTERATEVPDIGVSLRRQREDEGSESSEGSRPSDFPSKKRKKSSRMMDLPVPKSIFWDPKDRTTRHDDYPTMSMSDFNAFHDHASEKGERFVHGEEIFDTTLRSFRASRSPSLDPETTTRAQSEPTKEEGRRMMMKRDDRKFADDDVNGVEPRPFLSKDAAMPATARGSHEPESSTSENGNATNIPSSGVQPVVGNDFQPPKRILGKIIATGDSCLPTITLNVTETITSWGRGFKNTMRYSNGQDIRVPKYAFKIFLFKPNFYTAAGNLPTNATPGNGKNSTDQDMAFYISNKASSGIFINGINLPSHDRQNPYTASKFWGELRTGDIVTVWRDDTDEKKCVRFRFECYWGLSKEPRKEGEQFRIVPEGDFLNTIERACLSQEKNMMADIERREQEERAMLAEHKRAEKARREAAGSTNAPVSLKLFRPPGTESPFNHDKDKPKPKST